MEPGIIGVIIVMVVLSALIYAAVRSHSQREAERAQTALRIQQWRESILAKYADPTVAQRILHRVIWVGESAEQLRDSLGRPEDIDEKVLKTKRKEIWKYYRRGANRYGLKVTVENNFVTGWDEKL
jgi:hypothetical protein